MIARSRPAHIGMHVFLLSWVVGCTASHLRGYPKSATRALLQRKHEDRNQNDNQNQQADPALASGPQASSSPTYLGWNSPATTLFCGQFCHLGAPHAYPGGESGTPGLTSPAPNAVDSSDSDYVYYAQAVRSSSVQSVGSAWSLTMMGCLVAGMGLWILKRQIQGPPLSQDHDEEVCLLKKHNNSERHLQRDNILVRATEYGAADSL
mmetsp:Transcript_51085/g.95168  ORF Transcript_51085/g.95168 Transcript_51085/m.95168 type:complete len:207 (-) Transcript_51085:26-646(-)|eukprot:CAMPEP_0114313360 /NCGR_PEP_ID=MMETSP0059-20121206/21071_1 /TAXON_ID=36894 /ORGANISM="Pyramimonas parkeae, Strain CCMP726" /LENGTH=206 /DNA_ID=CAMNT_0001438105 /DNA_START=33 /DNA_END=653 /DNA_ORIENTATION=-